LFVLLTRKSVSHDPPVTFRAIMAFFSSKKSRKRGRFFFFFLGFFPFFGIVGPLRNDTVNRALDPLFFNGNSSFGGESFPGLWIEARGLSCKLSTFGASRRMFPSPPPPYLFLHEVWR